MSSKLVTSKMVIGLKPYKCHVCNVKIAKGDKHVSDTYQTFTSGRLQFFSKRHCIGCTIKDKE